MLKESDRTARTEDVSEGPTGLRQTVRTLRDQARGHPEVIGSLKEQLQRNAAEVSDWERRNGRPTTEPLRHKTARQRLAHKVGTEARHNPEYRKRSNTVLYSVSGQSLTLAGSRCGRSQIKAGL